MCPLSQSELNLYLVKKGKQKVGCKPIFNSGGSFNSAKKGHWESFSTSNSFHFRPEQSPKDRLRNLRKARPSPPSLHFGTKGLKCESPLSQRGGSGRESAERRGNRTASPRRVHGRAADTGVWKRESYSHCLGATQENRPQAGPARMRNATRFPGPRRDVNPEPRQRPRPRARACAPAPARVGWRCALSPQRLRTGPGAG